MPLRALECLSDLLSASQKFHARAACLQVTLQCQERGRLLAELWQGLHCLVHAALAACEAARLSLASDTATTQSLQAAMPVVQDQFFRCEQLSDCHVNRPRSGFPGLSTYEIFICACIHDVWYRG